MPGVGPKDAKIMLVLEFPENFDDKKGIPCKGNNGHLLRKALEDSGFMPENCYITHAIKCCPPQYTLPTSTQILSCFSKLEQEILEIKPKIIMLLGPMALEAILKENSMIKYRGWTIPYEKYQTILLPTYSPSYVSENKFSHMVCLLEDIKKFRTFEPYEKYDLNNYVENHDILTTVSEIEEKILKPARQGFPYAFDIETVGGDKENPKNGVKPYYNNSRILICGVAFSGKHSYSFDITEETLPCLRELYSLETNKFCHNMKFEQIWGLVKANAPEFNLDYTDDTMLLSYVLDERKGIHSLDFQSFVRLGIHKLEGVDQYKKRMDECPYELIHPYCGVDCKNTFRLLQVYKAEISNYPQLQNVYRNILLEGALATNRMEMEGLVVDWDRLETIGTDYKERIKHSIQSLYALPQVVKFKQKYGKFNFKSTKDISQYIIDNFGEKALKITDKKNFSSDASVLTTLAEKGDKFSQTLLEFRDLTKAHSTYIKGFREYRYNDNKLHTNYNMHGTETMRTSSDSPNLQNVDKHKHKEIRTIFIPPEDHVILSSDYEGAEIAGITMASGDKQLSKEIKEKINIHGKWAKILFDIPEDENTNWKEGERYEQRFQTKNKFFFPSCYGASPDSISKSIGMPKSKIQEIQEFFFEEYSGLKQYHEKVIKEYIQNGYITTFFGNRRRAPLAYNQIINTPIQSLMGIFTTLSLIGLVGRGYRIPLDVHDDLTFYIKYDRIKEAYKEIREVMIGWDFPFINVPLEIECSVGPNWGELVPIEKVIDL